MALEAAQARAGGHASNAFDFRYTPKLLGQYSAEVTLMGHPITGSPVLFDVLAGVPDVKFSRLIPPEPPLLSESPYQILLVAIDKFGNECGTGGADFQAELSSPNLPPGQPQPEVVDRGDGTYAISFCLKTSCEVNVCITLATEQRRKKEDRESFPPLPLSFQSAQRASDSFHERREGKA